MEKQEEKLSIDAQNGENKRSNDCLDSGIVEVTESVYEEWFGANAACWLVSECTGPIRQFGKIENLISFMEERKISLDFPLKLLIANIGDIKNLLYSLRMEEKHLDVYFRTPDYYGALQIHYERKYLYWYELVKNMKSEKKNVVKEILDMLRATVANTDYSYVDFSAERRDPGSKSGMNGYYVAAKHGAIMREERELDILNNILYKQDKEPVQSLNELVASAEGMKFWQKFGFGFSGRIYLKEKGAENLNIED